MEVMVILASKIHKGKKEEWQNYISQSFSPRCAL